ncbi:response regulator transcription factor [Sphingobacterium prati]|uniref:response regulator transcription factor n=1 Tax=Sphingobacterium prati TaxID=2737006 RepID=UPI00155353A2|nr:response regulator transcription factor [Sphingobacterium prati]NPE46875.1 response regulator transcription factor [Sphingobacterium prati]
MTRLLLVDDHKLVRYGFQLILEAQENINVIAEAENGDKALKYLAQVQPDLILTDIHMDVMDGLKFIRHVKALYPIVKIVVLSMDDKIQTIHEALNSGADGYLLKSSHVDEILFGIKQVMDGLQYVSAALGIELINYLAHYIDPQIDKKEIMVQYEISERELSVLELIAEGYTNAEIADKIFLSKRTVEGQRQLLLEKTNSRNTAQLIQFGFQKRLLC